MAPDLLHTLGSSPQLPILAHGDGVSEPACRVAMDRARTLPAADLFEPRAGRTLLRDRDAITTFLLRF